MAACVAYEYEVKGMIRFGVLLALVSMAPMSAFAEPESWKIFLRASGTWSSLRGVEIDSAGTLVTHEGESERMPRCAMLTQRELDHLSSRVAEAARLIGQTETEWGAIALDIDYAHLTIKWRETGKILRVRMPLARTLIDGSPPEFLVELVEEGWRLRESAVGRCRG